MGTTVVGVGGVTEVATCVAVMGAGGISGGGETGACDSPVEGIGATAGSAT